MLILNSIKARGGAKGTWVFLFIFLTVSLLLFHSSIFFCFSKLFPYLGLYKSKKEKSKDSNKTLNKTN